MKSGRTYVNMSGSIFLMKNYMFRVYGNESLEPTTSYLILTAENIWLKVDLEIIIAYNWQNKYISFVGLKAKANSVVGGKNDTLLDIS